MRGGTDEEGVIDMKFRKKPIIVEAVQWKMAEGWNGTQTMTPGVFVEVIPSGGLLFYVVTIHDQKAYLDEGDWVITEPDGVRHYPCKPDIFKATYDPVEQ